ncbi:MAG: ATP-binding protein [Xanthomonadales bacterium]|nr:ATP-binding protein [Xanthomonadales bacterium]
MITSNLDFDEWDQAFPANRILGVATLDRLRHAAYRVVLDGDSFRAPRDPAQAPKPPIPKHPKNRNLRPRSRPVLGSSRWRHYGDHGWRL